MKPVASFKKIINGLSVSFTDSSFNVPTTWKWNFGDGSPISTLQNPLYTYATEGVYWVVLTVENADGSDTVVSQILLSLVPGLDKTIAQMVLCEIPAGVYIDTTCFEENIKKWQLFLQPLTSPKISDVDVFNEVKWPSLVRVLISKLIIYEYLEAIIKQNVISLNGITQQTIVQNNVKVHDYKSTFNATNFNPGPILVNAFTINGNSYNYPIPFTNIIDMVNWLNTLNLGIFNNSPNLESLENPNIVNSLEYTVIQPGVPVPIVVNFVESNEQYTTITVTNTLDNNAGNYSGQSNVKYIETGPSRVEWFDKSEYWANMFARGGAMELLKQEICLWGARLRIILPMCNIKTKTALFRVTKRKCKPGDGELPDLSKYVL